MAIKTYYLWSVFLQTDILPWQLVRKLTRKYTLNYLSFKKALNDFTVFWVSYTLFLGSSTVRTMPSANICLVKYLLRNKHQQQKIVKQIVILVSIYWCLNDIWAFFEKHNLLFAYLFLAVLGLHCYTNFL